MATLAVEFIQERNCKIPKGITRSGKHVIVHSMQLDHLPQLFETLNGDGTTSMYDFLVYGPFEEFHPFRDLWTTTLAEHDSMFAIEDIKTKKFAGIASIGYPSSTNGVLEIGVIFSPILQRTIGATETFYLVAEEAFKVGCRRLEWKCDNAHEGSTRAAVRFGFTPEAVFRQHQIVKGKNRDTAWFSMLDFEWAEKKAALEMWMDPANFDVHGSQKESLLHYQERVSEKTA